MEIDNTNSASGASLQEYLQILRRRRAIIWQALVLIAVVGTVITLMTRPVYEASAEMLVDPPALSVSSVDANNPLASLFAVGQQQSVDTQVQVLQAGPLMDQVAQQVGPADLSVSEVGDTNVLADVAQAATPQRAADAANTLFQLYITQSAARDAGQLDSTAKFVQGQLQQATKKLSASEAALSRFRLVNHLADLAQNRSNQIARVAALTDGEQKAQGDLAALRAQIAADQRLLAHQPATLPVRLQSSNGLRATLVNQINTLYVQRQGMTQKGGFTDKAPAVLAIDAQVAELKRQLAQQPALATSLSFSANPIVDSLRSELVTLQAQEASLVTTQATDRADLAQDSAQLDKYAQWSVQQSRLTQQRDGAQAAVNNFQSELADLTLREKAHTVSAHVIEVATPPDAPIRPKKVQGILFACLIGLFVGVCLALLQEFLDDRINTTEDATRLLGLPSLGQVPELTAADAKLLPQMRGLDPASESYRTLRTNIHFASIDAPLRTLLVTSACPGEGKTTTAANLAFAMAMDGKRVILVDTDLRRPSLHKMLELPPVPGLTDVLLGQATVTDALLEHADMPGMAVLMAGSTPPNPAELLNSRKFRDLVAELSEQVDLVIFDSPPLLAASDAQILASQMDGTVLVVETGGTRKAAAQQSLTMLRQARATILGLTYNKMRAHNGGYEYQYYRYSTVSLPGETGGSAAKDRNALEAPVEEKR